MKNKLKILALTVVLILVLSLAACDLIGELASVSISQTSGTLGVGETLQMTAVAYKQNGAATVPDGSAEISWVSTNQSVLSVDQNGLVTALNEGQATVIAIAKSGTSEKRASCDFDVKIIAVEGISFAGGTEEVAKGYTLTLQPIFVPANASNKKIVWSSDDESVAAVSDKGVVTGYNVGTATITATSEDGQKTANCQVTVKYVQLLTVSMPQDKISVAKGGTSKIEVNFYPTNASNKTVYWSCDTLYVAKIDKHTGLLEGLNMGTATITATSQEGGYTATCTVTVTEPNVTHMAIILPSPEIVIGQTAELSASVYPTEAVDNFTWYVSDEKIATVTPSTSGKTAVVKGLAEGTVTVTCVTGTNHIMATTMISVKMMRPSSITLSTYNLDIIIPSGYDSSKQAVFGSVFATLNTEAATAEVVWSSSNENIFTVVPTADSRSVVVKAIRSGTATLRALTNNSGVYAECTVAVGEIIKTSTELNTMLNGRVYDTYFLQANADAYDITSFTVPSRTIRIVGIPKLNSDETLKLPKIKCNFTVGDYATLILENIDLTETALLSVSGNAKAYLTNISTSGTYSASGNAIIVLNESNFSTASTVIDSSRVFIKNGNSISVKFGNDYKIATPQGKNTSIEFFPQEAFKNILVATGKGEFSKNNMVSYSIKSIDGEPVGGLSINESGIIEVGSGVSLDTYNVTVKYNHGTASTSDDWELIFPITVTAPTQP